jgi:hypothetical protein
VSRKRVLERYQHTGRYVPLSVIDEFYAHTDDHFKKIKQMVDGWIEVNGVTATIDKREGEPIPQDREYFTQDVSSLPTEPEKIDKIAKTASKKQVAEMKIKAATVSLKFLKGEKLEKANKIIKALNLAVKYLK